VNRHSSDWLLARNLVVAALLVAAASCKRMPNAGPERPTVIGPRRGGIDTAYTFRAAALDPEGDSVRLRFCWNDGDTSEWSGWVANGETVQMAHTWCAFGTYRVTAQARDPEDSISRWGPQAGWEILIDPVRWKCRLSSTNSGVYGLSLSLTLAPDGTVYADAVAGDIVAVNPDGTVKWRVSGGTSVPSVGPNGNIYFDYISIYCLSPDGLLRWSFLLDSSAGSFYRSQTAVGTDGTVYTNYGSKLRAFRPDGAESWSLPISGVYGSDPVIGPDGTIYVSTSTDFFHAVNPDGIVRWRYPMGTMGTKSAFGPDGTIIVYAQYDSLFALNPDGTLKWAVRLGSNVLSDGPVVAADGSIYLCRGMNLDGVLEVRNPDGTLRGIFEVQGGVRGVPALAADGTVYVNSGARAICALDQEGNTRWRYDTGAELNSELLFGPEGIAYFRAYDALEPGEFIYCINVPTGPAEAPWPMYQHDPQRTGCADPSR